MVEFVQSLVESDTKNSFCNKKTLTLHATNANFDVAATLKSRAFPVLNFVVKVTAETFTYQFANVQYYLHLHDPSTNLTFYRQQLGRPFSPGASLTLSE